MYQYFKRQLKTPTCFGSSGIYPQGVLKVLHWNYLWCFLCVVGVWQREIWTVIWNGMSNLYGIVPKLPTWIIIDVVDLDLPCGVCVSGALSWELLLVAPCLSVCLSAYPSVCPSVRPSAWKNSAHTGRIFMKFDIWVFFENLFRKFNINQNRTRITGTVHEVQYKFLIILCSVLLKWGIFQTKYVEKIKTWALYSANVSFFENRNVYDIMWKNIVEPDRPQMSIWRTGIPCWIPKTTNTHSEYLILIVFPLQ